MKVGREERRRDLRQERSDGAQRIERQADASMTARHLVGGPRQVRATPGYFARRGMPQHPDELAAHNCMVYAQGSGAGKTVFMHDGQPLEIDLQGRLRTNAAEGVRAAVLAELGLAVVSTWMFAPELASGQVVRALQSWSLPAVDLWAVFPAGRLPSLKARRFIDYLGEQLQGNPVLKYQPPL